MMRSLMMSNSQMRGIIDRNPELVHPSPTTAFRSGCAVVGILIILTLSSIVLRHADANAGSASSRLGYSFGPPPPSSSASPPTSSSLKNRKLVTSTAESHYDHLLKSSVDNHCRSKQIHSSLITSGLIQTTPHLTAQIIINYSKLGHPRRARSLFDELVAKSDKPGSFLWNTMIRAYANNGQWLDTLDLYSLMRRNGVWPNNYTYPFVLKACGNYPNFVIWWGKMVHGEVIRNGLESDLYVEAALVDWYAKCGELNDARKVFDGMLSRDLVCWTAMITAYEQAELPQESLMMFGGMQQQKGMLADSVTVVSVASAVGQLGDIRSARSVHAYAVCCGILEDVCGGNAIVAMYGKCGDVESARMAFDRMEERDIISWNSVLSGYVQNGQAREALLLFEQMKEFGCRPNPVTALNMVSACAFLGSRHLGMKIQDFLVYNKIKVGLTLRNALMDMYAKCGDVETATRMFNDVGVTERDVTSWNIMISALGMHGRGNEALNLYSRMQEEGVQPNHITFMSVLSACSHAGLINEGKNCFADMLRLSVKQEVKHYACMVDMLGRAGLLNDAFDLIRTMPSPPNDGVWGALLLACRVHGNSELGEVAANNLFQLEPEHPGYYVLMSNVYAASRKWQEVGNLRMEMKSRGLVKPAAMSTIEYGDEIVGFQIADRSNPFRHEVYKKLESIATEMKMQGYMPDRSCVLHDVEEEDKDHILNYHSEKLAVAFGIMKSAADTAITVTKNLRICCDCHSAFKFISDIYRRRIIIRDANRFHQFEAGSCSCNDYW